MGKAFHYADQTIEAIMQKRSILVVGLDPQLQYMPVHLREEAVIRYGRTERAVQWAFEKFNSRVIDAVEPFAVGIKPQSAFYEIYGSEGIEALENTITHARAKGLLVIGDAKRGDGGDTAQAYADGYLGEVPFWGEEGALLGTARSPLRMDALTIEPWIGEATFKPFLEVMKMNGTGAFVVVKSSFNPNSEIEQAQTASGERNWQMLARMVERLGERTEGERGYRSFGVVMGATYPKDAPTMRSILPKSFFLVPGYGAQGGGADGAVVGVNPDGFGCVVNSARGIIYAYHPVSRSKFQCESARFTEAAAKAAEFARDELNAALQRAGKLNR